MIKLSAALIFFALVAAFGYSVGKDLALRDNARDRAVASGS